MLSLEKIRNQKYKTILFKMDNTNFVLIFKLRGIISSLPVILILILAKLIKIVL